MKPTEDELYAQALAAIRASRRASTSTLQRRLRIGYFRAARLMELMEQRGIVGPENGASPREILVDLDKLLGSASPSPRWRVIGHPLLAEKHMFHKHRFVVTSDAVVEVYDSNPDVRNHQDWDKAWGLRNGVIICELKDSIYQGEYARLIAAAPELEAKLDEGKRIIADLVRSWPEGSGHNLAHNVNRLREWAGIKA